MDLDHPDHALSDVGYGPDLWSGQAEPDPSEHYSPEEGELEEETHIAASAVHSEVGEKRPREDEDPPRWTEQEYLEWIKAQQGEPATPSQI